MSLFRKFFYRKPPDGLLEISERVYVFDCCFTTDVLENDEYKVYMGDITSQLRDNFPDSSFMVFNFREGEHQSFLTEILSEYDITVMDYPRQYEGCPLLTMEMVHHFLKSSESWLSLSQQNILLMHCEVGGWPVLAFMLAGLLIYRKQYTGEQKTLDMIYKQAPRELLQLLSPLNPLPSQMRYLQYISRRNVSSIWPPLDSTLFVDCIILRFIPNFHGYGGCRPLFRIFGHDPFTADDRTPKILFSTPKRSKAVQLYQQAECELVKFDIHCHVQGDVVLECISLDDDLERELMMFRVMFNTAFIRSNILMLNRDEIDILWDAKDRFLKNFRAEILFSEMDTSNAAITVELPHIGDKDGLPMEAFAKVQEIFSNLSWMDTKGDAPLHVLQKMAASNVSKEKQATVPPQNETTEIIPQKSSPDLFKANPLTNDASDIIARSSPTTPRKKYISLLKHSSDTNAMNKKTQLPNVAMLHHPDQPKKISHFLQSSQSSPVLSRNSLQTSPTHVSRYHSAPSALGSLGITALLHDHDAFGRSEVAYSMPLPRSAPTLLPDSISAMPETSENKTASLTAPSPESQPLKLLPTPRPPLAAATNASLLTSLPMSPSVCLPFSESHLRNDPITPIIANSVVSLTIKAPSISLSTSGQKPSSLLLASKVQSIPLPPPLPPPPLMPSSRKRSIPSVVSQKTPDIAKIIASNPSISNTSFPVKDNAFLPAKYEASSPVKGRASSLGKVQSTATTPPQPLLPSVGISSFSLAPSTTTYVLPPPPPPTPPSPPPLPPTTSIKGMPSTASLPPPPPPPPSAIHRKDMQSTPFLTSPLHPTLTIIKKDKPSTVHLPPAPPSYPPSNSFPHASLLKDACPPPPPPPPSSSVPMLSVLASPSHHPSQNSSGPNVPTVPPSPCPSKGLSPFSGSSPLSGVSALPGGIKGPNLVRLMSNSNRSLHSSTKKASLKPLHWVKVTRAMQGSLWAETQKTDEASRAPEFDMSELESLFSAAATNSERGSDDRSSGRSSLGQKSVRIQLIDLRRANNCEIMLTKVKIPLSDLMNSVLALDESVLDVDQVDNLIKFCPNKEEMDLLKNFNGDKERLGKCEQYFLELMKVPRVESKLRVFAFKIQFRSQVADLSVNLNIVNSASQEIRNSTKLKRIMQTILSLGNALNQGTARGSAIGFRLDSLLKLTDTRARNNKMTLMHYLCKVIAEKLPELLDFPKDLVSLEIASKIQLKALAEEMQSISKGLEKVEQELITSENDGSVSETFRKILKEFLVGAEAEVKALTSLYSNVGRNADALALYFGEDPARCPFEQVTNTLLNFIRLFIRAHEENCKHLELEKKKQHREAESEKMKLNSAKREGDLTHSPSKNARFR